MCLLSFSVDRTTTGRCNLNVAFVGLLIAATGLLLLTSFLFALLIKKQFPGQFKAKYSSHLMYRISSVLPELLKEFNGKTVSSISFSTLLPSTFFVILAL